jgi:hypothetical protein
MKSMQIGLFVMHLLDVIFFLGLAGSSVVVVYSFIEDTFELFSREEPQSTQSAAASDVGGGSSRA